MLGYVGVVIADIADERLRMSEMAFGRTRNRSLLGTLNDFAFMAQSVDARRAEPESPEELVRFLSQTPILPLGGASPIELRRAVFEAGSGNVCAAPVLDCQGAGNCWSDAVKDPHG